MEMKRCQFAQRDSALCLPEFGQPVQTIGLLECVVRKRWALCVVSGGAASPRDVARTGACVRAGALGDHGVLQLPHHRRRSAPSRPTSSTRSARSTCCRASRADRHQPTGSRQTAPRRDLSRQRDGTRGPVARVVGAKPAASGEATISISRTRRSPASQGHAGRHSWARLHHRSARAGHRDAGLGPPVPQGDLLFVLENALRMSGVALVRDRRGYSVCPSAEAVGPGGVDRGARRSRAAASPWCRCVCFGARRLQAAGQLRRQGRHGARRYRAQPPVIQGSGADRRRAVDTVLSFDADWMRGQSVGIFPVRNTTPEP